MMRRHLPEDTSHTRRLLSKDEDAMYSSSEDQSKSARWTQGTQHTCAAALRRMRWGAHLDTGPVRLTTPGWHSTGPLACLGNTEDDVKGREEGNAAKGGQDSGSPGSRNVHVTS